jgi:hypothetical protein
MRKAIDDLLVQYGMKAKGAPDDFMDRKLPKFRRRMNR